METQATPNLNLSNVTEDEKSLEPVVTIAQRDGVNGVNIFLPFYEAPTASKSGNTVYIAGTQGRHNSKIKISGRRLSLDASVWLSSGN